MHLKLSGRHGSSTDCVVAPLLRLAARTPMIMPRLLMQRSGSWRCRIGHCPGMLHPFQASPRRPWRRSGMATINLGDSDRVTTPAWLGPRSLMKHSQGKGCLPYVGAVICRCLQSAGHSAISTYSVVDENVAPVPLLCRFVSRSTSRMSSRCWLDIQYHVPTCMTGP